MIEFSDRVRRILRVLLEQPDQYLSMETLAEKIQVSRRTIFRELDGLDEAAEKSKAAQYTSRFQDAVSQGRIDDCISIARNGVAEYPNNYELLNRLMYVLFLSGDSDGNIPEWQENMQKYDSEITMLGERIMKYCPDQNPRQQSNPNRRSRNKSKRSHRTHKSEK